MPFRIHPERTCSERFDKLTVPSAVEAFHRGSRRILQSALFLFVFFLLLANCAHARIIYQGLNKHQVALTFDDGPAPVYTAKVLDILKREKVKATFFVVGQKVTMEADLLRRITAEGHEVGNHTYYHSKLSWINNAKMADELINTSLAIYQTSGAYDKLFRPPHGTLPRSKIKELDNLGYDIVLWSVNADDFYHTGWGVRTPKSIANRVLGRIKGGDVVLMHDDSLQITQALPIIIAEIKNRGYQFVTVSQLCHN